MLETGITIRAALSEMSIEQDLQLPYVPLVNKNNLLLLKGTQRRSSIIVSLTTGNAVS